MKPGFDYTVQEGDCVSSIAEQTGFYWQTIWNANPRLKALRKNPNILFADDIIRIPDFVERIASCATDKRHTFVKKGTPAKFRLVLEQFNVPLANRRYILDIDGKIFQGQTDGTGLLEVSIDPAAQRGHLQLPDDQVECDLALGDLDPVGEIEGIQQRLQNLGFLTTEPSGEMDDDTRDALIWFQSSVNLPATGELDEATRDKLFGMQDRIHEQSSASDAPPDEADVTADEPVGCEPEIDPQEDEAEMADFTSWDD